LFTVYILFSASKSQYYSGHTSDLARRLIEHNSGKTTSTKTGKPWRLIWTAEVATRTEAVMLEIRIKKRGANRFLEDFEFWPDFD
jgi:putative endonuclease